MASFTAAAPACSLASSAASLAGLKVSLLPVRPCGFVSALPVRVVAVRSEAQAVEKEREILKRRALVLGAFASAIAVASNVNEANAAEAKKKKGKCPTLCVQNPTASCCFGF